MSDSNFQRLDGVKVAVVEDDGMISMLLEDMLADSGAEAAGTAATVPEALALVEAGGFHAAILDLNLSGKLSTRVADALLAKGVPFIFATGYGTEHLPQYAAIPSLGKPYKQAELVRTLAAALAAKA